MSRIINIYHTNHKNILKNYDNIDISEIHNIINYSTDFIRFDQPHLFDYTTSQNIIKTLIHKIKLNGHLMLGLLDTKIISRLYADNVLSDNNFIEKIQHCKSVWSIDLLKDFISPMDYISINKIQNDNQNYILYVTIERILI